MARIVLGPIVTDARNKLGSVVFSRVRSGPFTRNWLKPRQPKTIYQQNVKTVYATLINYWSNLLTPANRAAWQQLANLTRWPSKMGNTWTPTPQQLFVKLNALAIEAGGSVLTTPGPTVNPATPGNIYLGANNLTQAITLDTDNALPSGYGALIRCTKPLSAGINNFNRWLFLITPLAGTMFSDNFPGGGPVPPWTAAPTYNAAQFTESGDVLQISAIAADNQFYTTVANSNYTITHGLQAGDAHPLYILTSWRLNPTSGSQLNLQYTYTSGQWQLCKRTTWTGADTILATNSTNPIADLAWHTITITSLGNVHTVHYDTALLFTLTVPGFTDLGIGLNGYGYARNLRTYSCTAVTGAPAVPGDISSAYHGKYGPFTTGQLIGADCRYVHLASGTASARVSTSTLVIGGE